MTVRTNSTPTAPREDGDATDDAVVWPEPSPLSSWWQQVMQASTEGRSTPRAS
ncbi:hypothetical protein [Nocardia sp. BMG51109]|uniref:hypothetical protein n=1 Tax=Nocardia sp. BMG51109 TaxID=1056816 RepID=UPI0004AFC56B|nr:hypothetical protein [Nocardia sp. BMG51109]